MKLIKLFVLLTFLVLNVGIAGAQQNYQYVDLGLPSGTLWATCNVGANNPWEAGYYFAWGETNSKSSYQWNNYKYANVSHQRKTYIFPETAEDLLIKYCTQTNRGYNGFTDGKTVLEASDDAATINMGNNWRMPTYEEYEELYANCTMKWTKYHDTNGYEVKGKNGKFIFLPAAGWCADTFLSMDANSKGYYWSSSCVVDDASALSFNFFDLSVCAPGLSRNAGCSVRAVRK